MLNKRNNLHWIYENYKQRMILNQWKEILLAGEDKLIFRGKLRQLRARKIGAGVVEIYKEPLK
jgi:hypothetical protein